MSNPLIYILAPFGLAFILFVVYLVVSIIIRDPGRPFRMFAAPPLEDRSEFRVHDSIPPKAGLGQGSAEEEQDEGEKDL